MPSLPSLFRSAAAAAPPGNAGGGSRQRLRRLTSSRGRGRGRGCVPRRRATSTPARGGEGRREGGRVRQEEEGLGRRGVTASPAAAATAPPPRRRLGKRRRAAAPRRGRGSLPRFCLHRQQSGWRPARASHCSRGWCGRRRRRRGAAGGGGGPRGGADDGRGSRATRGVRPGTARARGVSLRFPRCSRRGMLSTPAPAVPQPSREDGERLGLRGPGRLRFFVRQ